MTGGDGGPAFPRVDGIEQDPRAADRRHVVSTDGMSLRDYFAGQALAGLVGGRVKDLRHYDDDRLAERSYDLADAMLKAREEQ